jgi:hypothetical protein
MLLTPAGENDAGRRACDTIGPIGMLARLGVGLALIAVAVFVRDPSWRDAALGLLIAPGILLALAAIRAGRSPQQLRATGPIGYVVNTAVAIAAFVLPATAGAAFLFYGGSGRSGAQSGRLRDHRRLERPARPRRPGGLCAFRSRRSRRAVRSGARPRECEAPRMKVELLYFDGCPSYQRLLPRLQALVAS